MSGLVRLAPYPSLKTGSPSLPAPACRGTAHAERKMVPISRYAPLGQRQGQGGQNEEDYRGSCTYCRITVAILGTALTASAGRRRCTPGYRPCIPNRRTDVDCYGGGGDGPRYTRPGVVYRVFGNDRYRLDADNDGRGCE